jgi:hypothetical protein
MAAEGDSGRDVDLRRPARGVRVLASLAVLALAGSYLAAQIDLVRRHQPGITPLRYWWPQVTRIWLPGVAAAVTLAAAAFLLHRRSGAK